MREQLKVTAIARTAERLVVVPAAHDQAMSALELLDLLRQVGGRRTAAVITVTVALAFGAFAYDRTSAAAAPARWLLCDAYRSAAEALAEAARTALPDRSPPPPPSTMRPATGIAFCEAP